MKNWPLFFLFFCVLLLKNGFSQEEVCLFSPPKNWKIALPKNKSEYVQVGFITQGEKGFHPSINLAIEEVDVTLREYIQAIKEIHTAKPDTKWRDLGKFKMEGGIGRLTEISNTGPWGPVKMLQAILVKNQKAYILTAATLKSEFAQFQREILKSLKTLKTAKDLFSFLPNTPQKQELFETFTSLTQKIEDPKKQQEKWIEFQNLASNFQEEMGPQWQFLLLKEGHSRIYNSDHP